MEIYFVRHGETSGNVAKRHQDEDSPLTLKGKRQVEAAALKVKDLQPTHLVTSNLVRAMDTASEISKVTGLIPDTHDEFIELRRPEQLYGKRHTSAPSFIYYIKWLFGIKSPFFTNGESYTELLARIKRAQAYLETLPNDARVVVVSHSVFISFFIEHMCNNRKMNFIKAAHTFKKLRHMPNTEICKVQYSPSEHEGVCEWVEDFDLK